MENFLHVFVWIQKADMLIFVTRLPSPTLYNRQRTCQMFSNYVRLLLSITGNRCWYIQVNETCLKFNQSSNFEFYDRNATDQNVIQFILAV
jgi:hypothetical protein